MTQKMDAFEKWSTVFVCIEIVVCLLGIVFNAIVILTIFKNTYRLSAPTYLILSIAVSDFLSCSVAIPFSIARRFEMRWPFGMVGCQTHAFLMFFLALVSLSHLAAISAGKYLTITRSVSKQTYLNTKTVTFVILSSWTVSGVFSAVPLLVWSRINGLDTLRETCTDEDKSALVKSRVYFGVVFFTSYILALVVILCSYYKIHKVSKNIVYNTGQMGGLSAANVTQALLKKHRKSAMYFLTVIAAFMLSWSPYAIISVLIALKVRINPISTSACSLFAQTSFFLNPILYAIVSRKFRRRMVVAVPMPTRRPNRRVRPAVVPSSVGPLAL